MVGTATANYHCEEPASDGRMYQGGVSALSIPAKAGIDE